MPFVSGRYTGRARDGSPRRRGAALALTALVHALLLFLLLRLAPFIPLSAPPQPRTATFDIAAEGPAAPTRTETRADARERAGGSARAAAREPQPQPAESETPDRPGPITLPPGIIIMNRNDYAGSDVARAPRAADTGSRAAAAGDGDATADADSAGGGGGGGAEKLYDVDWYRRPTNAELAPYLPRRPGLTGWGMIACRTAPRFRVEDCRELGQSPAGSGLARAVREAAWQFRVLPPRVGSREQIGVWVRIRIDYVEGEAK